MTIALVSTAVALGGAERYMLELARWLVGAGESVTLLVAQEIAASVASDLQDMPVDVKSAGIGWDYGPEDNIDGAEYVSKVMRQKMGMLDALGANERRPDLILLNANWPTHYIGAMQASSALEIPFAVHFHLCPHRIFLNRQAAEAHARVLGNARFLSCVSNNNRFFLEKTFGPRTAFRVILNGSRFDVRDEERISLLSRKRSNAYLLVGRLEHQKGIIDILPALTRMRSTDGLVLQVLGDGPLRKMMEANLPSQGSAVEFLGNVTDVRERMSNASAMIIASHFEGLSLAILEAMSLGCVPIVSRASSAAEIVTDDKTGFLFNVGDWRSLIGAMSRFSKCDQSAVRAQCLEKSKRFTRRSMFEAMRQTLEIAL